MGYLFGNDLIRIMSFSKLGQNICVCVSKQTECQIAKLHNLHTEIIFPEHLNMWHQPSPEFLNLFFILNPVSVWAKLLLFNLLFFFSKL